MSEVQETYDEKPQVQLEPLQGAREGDSVMEMSIELERLVLDCMNKFPAMAKEQGKDYAKRITSKVEIDGNVTFGIVLPEGGRVDIGKINPIEIRRFNLLNAFSELLILADSVWEVMVPTAAPSPNTNKEENVKEEDVKQYLARVDVEANRQLRNEDVDVRHLFNTAPKIKYISERETTVGYRGLIVYIPEQVEIDLPEPWYNELMNSRKADMERERRGKKLANIEMGNLDVELAMGRLGN